MLHDPMDILNLFPVRKTGAQKLAFRDAAVAYAKRLGYKTAVEDGRFGCRNVIFGDPESAGILVTAHYDTCARLPFPNLITPCSLPGFLLCQILQFAFIVIAALLLAVVECSLFCGILTLLGRGMGDGWILFVILTAPSLIWFNIVPVIIWMLAGSANPNNVNDNSSGVITLLEIMKTLPENQRSRVCFVLFDLEETGLIGSASYRKTHTAATNRQLVLNLDCVGEGDHLRLFPTKTLLKDRRKCTSLYKACGYFGNKSLIVQEKGFFIYPSDQIIFPYGAGICALKKNRLGLYLGKIHTPKDTVLDQTNVNILRAALTTYICCSSEFRKEEMK